MPRLEGYETGDEVWLAWVHIEPVYFGDSPVQAKPRVDRGTVFMADHGLIQVAGQSPRATYFGEIVFRTRGEAWAYVASRIRAGADALSKQAAEAAVESAVAASAEAA